MNLTRNIFTIQCNGIIQQGYNLYLTPIGEHEVKRFELFHLLNWVDKGEGEDYVRVDRLEVALYLWIIFGVDCLWGDYL